MAGNQSERTQAWRAALEGIGAGGAQRILLGGPSAEALAGDVPAPIATTAPGLALLGPEMVPLEAGATPQHTGLADGAVDAAVMLEAWDHAGDLGAVVREADRIVAAGGAVWLGRRDLETLASSQPAAYRAALLYRGYPSIADEMHRSGPSGAEIGMAAVRAGLRPVTEVAADLPVAVHRSSAAFVEAVRDGSWLGIDQLSATQIDQLLETLAATLDDTVRFPYVESQPWTLVRGLRPG